MVRIASQSTEAPKALQRRTPRFPQIFSMVLSCFNTPVTPQVWPLLWMKDYKKKKLKNLDFRLRQAHSNDIF